MFHKILVANRGEIALRVMKTAREMGIKTVAVYSDADESAQHVKMADEAVHIGPAPAAESYLNVEAILAAAKQTGAQAIHPGYGFLSENAGFARACAEAGVTFIGPKPESIDAMGSKSAAKALMEKAGVPLLPGYHGDDQTEKNLLKQAEKIGFPVLIKAVAGGGGRGMKQVMQAKDFAAALDSAKREAAKAFGNDDVLIEKLLVNPRHIEVQVFGDEHGNVVHLFERDCSIQRRHQKVVEEAPAPGVSDELRAKFGEAAVNAAKAVDYVGAGTVEFLMDDVGDFYFMEMNTRLQVEHPVTELITGFDLVEWQLKVAYGEVLPATQKDIQMNGHAVEVRLYAEDPAHDFAAATGKLHLVDIPANLPGTRVDGGFVTGDEITPFYDAMLAKLVGYGPTRTEAIRHLQQLLDATFIAGPATNVRFLAKTVGHDAFKQGAVHTGFIGQHEKDLLPAADTLPAIWVLAAVADVLSRTPINQCPGSPWARVDGWRLSTTTQETVVLHKDEQRHAIELTRTGNTFTSGKHKVEAMFADGVLSGTLDGAPFHARVVKTADKLYLLQTENDHVFERETLSVDHQATQAGEGDLTAPITGMVIKVSAKAGDKVQKGGPLMIMEALKTEYHINAPADGVVEDVLFGEGQSVSKGAILVHFVAEGVA